MIQGDNPYYQFVMDWYFRNQALGEERFGDLYRRARSGRSIPGR